MGGSLKLTVILCPLVMSPLSREWSSQGPEGYQEEQGWASLLLESVGGQHLLRQHSWPNFMVSLS